MTADPASRLSPWEALLPRIREAIAPRYDVLRLIGQGGMAGVFLARDPRLDRHVAIKVISPGLMMDAGMVERFNHEARTQARFQHANIVPIFDVGEADDLHFIAMPYMSGRTLGQVMNEDGVPLEIPIVRAWLYEVGGALMYAHARGVVHRDVKPGNIILSADGRAMVTDFGIAKVADEPALTGTGMVLGTPTYMSPEQCIGQGVTGSSDQYALGIVAYQMLTGQVPFSGEPYAILNGHMNGTVAPITELRPDCPPELSNAVARMLEKSPDDRWPTVDEAVSAGGATPPQRGDPLRARMKNLAKVVSSFALPSRRARLSIGGATPLPIVPLDENGEVVPDRSVVFSSDALSIISITDAGHLTAHGPGTAQISLRCGGAEDSITIETVATGEQAGLQWAPPEPDPEVADRPDVGAIVGATELFRPTPVVPDAQPEETLDGEPAAGWDHVPPTSESPIAGGRAVGGESASKTESAAPIEGGRQPKPTWRRSLTLGLAGGAIIVALGLWTAVGRDDGGTGDPAVSDRIETSPIAQAAAEQPGQQSDLSSSGDPGTGSAQPDEAGGASPDELLPEPSSRAETEPETRVEGGTAPEIGAGTEPEVVSGSDSGPETGPEPEAGTRPEPETTAGTETETPTETPSGTPPPVEPQPLTPGLFVIEGNLPDGVRIVVTGDEIGRRTMNGPTIQLPPGRYRLAASAPGYEDSETELDLLEGATRTWDPQLALTRSETPEAPPETPEAPPETDTNPVEAIEIAIEGFISAFGNRRVDRVVSYLPDEYRDPYRAMMSMDVSRWDVTSGFEDVQQPSIDGSYAVVEFSFSLRTRDQNSGDQTQRLNWQARLEGAGNTWRLISVRPR